MPTLKNGVSDPEVTKVKRILAAQGYWLDGYGYSSKYTQRTADEVQNFQAQHLDADGLYLDEDGEVGPKTRWALKNPTGRAQRSGLIVVKPELEVVEAASDAVLLRLRLMGEALKWHGTKERPNGSNRGPKVDELVPSWARRSDGSGYPWCCFAVWDWYHNTFGEWPLDDKQHRGGVASAKVFAAGKRRFIANKPGMRPTPGDALVILYSRGGKPTGKGHIALVLANKPAVTSLDRLVYTIGGNEGNRVKVGQRSLEKANVAGWIDFFGDSRTESKKEWIFQDYPVDDAVRLTQAGSR